MLQGDTARALSLLDKLDKRYGLMPTETFARALCEAGMGDTAAARRSYMESFRQRAPLGWLWVTLPHFRSVDDSLWYEDVVDEGVALWKSRPAYVDGPNGAVPTPVTWVNNLFQQLSDSLEAMKDDHPTDTERVETEKVWAEVIALHGSLLDSIIQGLVELPSIDKYGVNTEFGFFVVHTDGEYTYKHRKQFKRWLKKRLIYPRTYAICFDRRKLLQREPLPYGIYNDLKTEELAPGYKKRRAAIGMGDDRLDGARFHWGR